MMERLLKFIILVTFWKVNDGQILQIPTNVTGTIKGSVTIDIFVDFAGNNTPSGGKLKSLLVDHVIGTEEIRIADGSDTNFKEAGESRFKGRTQTAFNATAGKYSLTLGDLNYEDDVKIVVFLFYTELPSSHTGISDEIDLIIKGGPTLCGNEIPAAPIFELSKPINIPLTLCGNPQPRLTYWFGSNPDTMEVTNITASSTNKHQYLYIIQLVNLKPSDCNSILKYKATGISADYAGQSRIDLHFTPELTAVTHVRQDTRLMTTWSPINTGGCQKVTYKIEYFLHDGNKTNVTVTIPAGSSSYTLTTTNSYDVISIGSISLQATHRTKSSVVTGNVTHITTTTTAPTTTTPPSNKGPFGGPVSVTCDVPRDARRECGHKVNTSTRCESRGCCFRVPVDLNRNDTPWCFYPEGDESNDVVLIAAVAGSVGFLVLLIVVVLVFCVCCRKSKSTFSINHKDKAQNLQMHSIHEYDQQKSAPIKSPKKPKNNPMYDIEPPTHHSFNNGGVTIEREEPVEAAPNSPDLVDSLPPTTNTPSKASSVRVADAQLRYYDPNEFGMTEDDSTDRLSPPVSPAPHPGDNYSYDNSGETIQQKPDLV